MILKKKVVFSILIVFIWFIFVLWKLISTKLMLSIYDFRQLISLTIILGYVIASVRLFRTPLYRQVNILLLGITLISIPLITAPSTIVQLNADTNYEKTLELKAAKKEYGKWWRIVYMGGRKISEKQLTDKEVRSKHSNAEVGFWFDIVLMYVIPLVVGTIITYSSIRKILLYRQNIKGT